MKPKSEPKHSTDTWTLRWINIHTDAHKNLKMDRNLKFIDNQQLYMAEQENRKNESNWYDMQIYFTTRWPLAETHMHFREKKMYVYLYSQQNEEGEVHRTAYKTKVTITMQVNLLWPKHYNDICFNARSLVCYFSFTKKFDMFFPSMKLTYFCKINFISPARESHRGE